MEKASASNVPMGAEYGSHNEIWKPCPGFETKYLVSNQGNIKSIGTYNTCKRGIIKQYKKKGRNGYMQVRLYDNNRASTIEVHSLVAKAFIANPYNYPMVNHMNEDKTDNRAVNLEWCTNQYNVRYSKSKAVKQYDKNGIFIEQFTCIADAAAKYKIPSGNISNCCLGKRHSAGGFIWTYV